MNKDAYFHLYVASEDRDFISYLRGRLGPNLSRYLILAAREKWKRKKEPKWNEKMVDTSKRKLSNLESDEE